MLWPPTSHVFVLGAAICEFFLAAPKTKTAIQTAQGGVGSETLQAA
jgi:hypothetical protein